MSTELHRTDHQALEGRLAARLAAALAERAEQTPHDIVERLRVGRERALVQARRSRLAAQAAREAQADVLVAGGAGTARLGRPVPWWQRAAATVPLVVLLAGLVAVNWFAERERVLAAAEIDAQLLADDLPPDAYSDPGFGEFLRSPPP